MSTKSKPRKRWNSIEEVIAANKEIGHHFFDLSSMRFFNSRIETGVLHKRYFITSEYPDSPKDKRYTIREVGGQGEIQTIDGFHRFATLRDAEKHLSAIVVGASDGEVA